MDMRFDNAFIRELPGDPLPGRQPRQVHGALYSAVDPTPVAAPRLLAWSPEMAASLGMDRDAVQSPAFAEVFAGNRRVPGMQPWAANYGGHQFGVWAGQLGDGRAISLGEAIGIDGRRWELQLKGAGPTPYSRGADGRAVLRSSVREFLCSEAMHHLGVPTTRALCLLGTGESVVRDMFYDGHPRDEPGAIVCRAAPSFVRFGSFELPYARGETGLLRQLADFVVTRDFPHLAALEDEARLAAWFAEVCERTAELVGHWMRVGFVHGVLNTDNMSILGLTLDYGPYGWIDEYDPDWTPNTTDASHRRYRFGRQPRIAGWNLSRLAAALSPLFADPAPLREGLDRYAAAWHRVDRANVAAKLGLAQAGEGDLPLRDQLQELMAQGRMDMTLTYRQLAAVAPDAPDVEVLEGAFYDEAARAQVLPALQSWLERYAARVRNDALPEAVRLERMRTANPRYLLRNYLVQQAIERAEQGDLDGIGHLLDLARRPYDEQPERAACAARRPDWARDRAGCSMLSCSS